MTEQTNAVVISIPGTNCVRMIKTVMTGSEPSPTVDERIMLHQHEEIEHLKSENGLLLCRLSQACAMTERINMFCKGLLDRSAPVISVEQEVAYDKFLDDMFRDVAVRRPLSTACEPLSSLASDINMSRPYNYGTSMKVPCDENRYPLPNATERLDGEST